MKAKTVLALMVVVSIISVLAGLKQTGVI